MWRRAGPERLREWKADAQRLQLLEPLSPCNMQAPAVVMPLTIAGATYARAAQMLAAEDEVALTKTASELLRPLPLGA